MFIKEEGAFRLGTQLVTYLVLGSPVIRPDHSGNQLQSVGRASGGGALFLRQGLLLIPLLYLMNALFAACRALRRRTDSERWCCGYLCGHPAALAPGIGRKYGGSMIYCFFINEPEGVTHGCSQNMMLLSELVSAAMFIHGAMMDRESYYGATVGRGLFLPAHFGLFGCKQRDAEHRSQDDVPVGDGFGPLGEQPLKRKKGRWKRIWVIGPVFLSDVTLRGIEDGLKTTASWRSDCSMDDPALQKPLKKSPPCKHHYEPLLLMMHYCLTGQRLALSCVNSSTAQEERLAAIPRPA